MGQPLCRSSCQSGTLRPARSPERWALPCQIWCRWWKVSAAHCCHWGSGIRSAIFPSTYWFCGSRTSWVAQSAEEMILAKSGTDGSCKNRALSWGKRDNGRKTLLGLLKHEREGGKNSRDYLDLLLKPIRREFQLQGAAVPLFRLPWGSGWGSISPGLPGSASLPGSHRHQELCTAKGRRISSPKEGLEV